MRILFLFSSFLIHACLEHHAIQFHPPPCFILLKLESYSIQHICCNIYIQARRKGSPPHSLPLGGCYAQQVTECLLDELYVCPDARTLHVSVANRTK
ncbi:hypothetical protein DUNSADRAFT_18070 [Dunaliella salina]|uniref:Secreted protein n=1 Tax=Dunaliella salina TaxID=3046 RepID=A0ABQ7G0Q5_DUNSA|nr:hypothetical protein DUNSADRAFT_18070 [Dunaliella salina]|eukprot:KAF5828192.1 hypothetical protein DUNSADRAFT_18070 [Dunaliella salina]